MKIETQYNLGDVFYQPYGKDVLELGIHKISVYCTSQGQRTQYQLSSPTSENYATLFQEELDKKLHRGELFLTKKEVLTYYIDLLTN